eukprot:GILK01008026.1.p1 GENE.GILK01008026.1~~GILK01008026.1.p1  ORF type:complete len:909 (+),score=167.22 GILK01008026.1:131-2857(+)
MLQRKSTEQVVVVREITSSGSVPAPSKSSDLNVGSLLRLFKSEFFDSFLAVYYLYKKQEAGVQDYLANKLYSMSDDDVDFFLAQLCNMLLQRPLSVSLERFIMDKCASSFDFAMKVFWMFQSAMEEIPGSRKEHVQRLWQDCEMAIVNTERPMTLRERQQSANRSSMNLVPIVSITQSIKRIGDQLANISQQEMQDSLKEHHGSSPMVTQVDGSPAQTSDLTSPYLRRRRTRQFSDDPAHEHLASHSNSFEEIQESAETEEKDEQDLQQLYDFSQKQKEAENDLTPRPDPSARLPRLESHKTLLASPTSSASLSTVPLDSPSMSPSDAANPFSTPMPSSSPPHVSHILPPPVDNQQPSGPDSPTQEKRISLHLPREAVFGDDSNNNTRDTSRDSAAMCRKALLGHTIPANSLDRYLLKQLRCDFFNTQLHLVQLLIEESLSLRDIPPDHRRAQHLRQSMSGINQWLASGAGLNRNFDMTHWPYRGLYLPLEKPSDPPFQIMRIPPEEAVCFSTRKRVPYLIWLETVDLSSPGELKQCLEIQSRLHNGEISLEPSLAALNLSHPQVNSIQPRSSSVTMTKKVSSFNGLNTLVPSSASASHSSPPSPSSPSRKSPIHRRVQSLKLSSPLADDPNARRFIAWGELKCEKEARIRKMSPFGVLPSWRLRPLIIKGGDDLRQEQLAVQLIQQFYQIFSDAQIPLYLRPFKILVTSSNSGIVEVVPDAISIDAVKKKTPNFVSLANLFEENWGEMVEYAHKNFAESLAAYSLVCYFLQIKDRHNGNILLDAEGHIVHIDFGYMLSNSPGSINFESAPFKFTQEYMDVMGGEDSQTFQYFRILLIRGFLEARKHCEKIILLVEMMQDSKMGCFQAGPATVQMLRDRFMTSLTETQSTWGWRSDLTTPCLFFGRYC